MGRSLKSHLTAGSQPSNLSGIHQAWCQIPNIAFLHLLESIPRRIDAILNAKYGSANALIICIVSACANENHKNLALCSKTINEFLEIYENCIKECIVVLHTIEYNYITKCIMHTFL